MCEKELVSIDITEEMHKALEKERKEIEKRTGCSLTLEQLMQNILIDYIVRNSK